MFKIPFTSFVMRPGWWNGIEFTAEQLRDISDAYDPKFREAKFTRDHAYDGGAEGWIKETHVDDEGILWAKGDISLSLAQDIQDGSYKYVSAEFLVDRESGKKYLSAVSLLGALDPAVTNQPPAILQFCEHGNSGRLTQDFVSVVCKFSDDDEQNKEETKSNKEVSKLKEKKEANVLHAETETAASAQQEQQSEQFAVTKEQFDALRDQLATMTAERDELKTSADEAFAKLAEAESKLNDELLKVRVEELIKQGYITATERDKHFTEMKRMSNFEVAKAFANTGIADAVEWYEAHLKERRPVPPTGRADVEKKAVEEFNAGRVPEDKHERIKAIAEERKIDYAAATRIYNREIK